MLSSATLFADGREANRPDLIIIRFCSRSYSVWSDFLFSFLFLGLIPSCLFAFAWSYQLFSSVHDRPGCRNLAHVRRLCACPAFQPPALWLEGYRKPGFIAGPPADGQEPRRHNFGEILRPGRPERRKTVKPFEYAHCQRGLFPPMVFSV